MSGTKEKILEVSLDLFSRKGFSAVSIRDICKEVNIKESSVYYHFKNKQAIIDELIYRFETIARELMGQLENSVLTEHVIDSPFYRTVCDFFFEKYLLNDFCNKVMRLLMIEQFNNVHIKNVYHKWLFDEPLNFQSKIFELLMNMKLIKTENSEYLAIKYYAPVFFFAQKWLFSGELSVENKNAFRLDAYQHIQLFFAEIGAI